MATSKWVDSSNPKGSGFDGPYAVVIPSMVTSKPSTILKIPAEMENNIFERLDPISSVCLGLTCKRFYQTHCSLHSKIELASFLPLPLFWRSGFHLYEMLGTWMGPDMWFCISSLKFCKKRSGQSGLLKTSVTFYPSQLKFVKHGKNVSHFKKVENLKEEREKLAADKNEKCYFYSVNILVEDKGGDDKWKEIKLSFDRELEKAKVQGWKDHGGHWSLGRWVPC